MVLLSVSCVFHFLLLFSCAMLDHQLDIRFSVDHSIALAANCTKQKLHSNVNIFFCHFLSSIWMKTFTIFLFLGFFFLPFSFCIYKIESQVCIQIFFSFFLFILPIFQMKEFSFFLIIFFSTFLNLDKKKKKRWFIVFHFSFTFWHIIYFMLSVCVCVI